MNHTVNDIKVFLNQVRSKGFFHLLSANVLIQIFAFASQLFVAGIISPDDLGRIKIIQTYLALFSIIAGMGLSSSTLKICSEGRSEAENRRYFNTAFFFTLISSSLLYLVVLIVNHFELLTSDQLIRMLLPLGLFPLITNSLFMLMMAYFQAARNIRLFSILTITNKVVAIAGIIVLTWLMGIKGYYIAYNISFILMVVVAFIASPRLFSSKLLQPERAMLNEHVPYARSSVFANITSEASSYIDILMISFLLKDNMEEIGYYSFALTLTIALRIFPSTVQQITLPYFSEKSRDKETFMNLYKRYNRLLYSVIIITLVLFVGLVPLFIELIFKGKYEASVPYLYLLGIGWSIRHTIQLRSSAIFGLGKIAYNGYTSLITLAVNLLVFPVMIHFYGFYGAACASIVSGIVTYLGSVYFFRRAIAKTKWEE